MSLIIKFSRLPAVVLMGSVGVGCVHAPLKQGLPAQQAMTQAYAQLYKTANYQFSGQMKVEQVDIRPTAGPKKDTAAMPKLPSAAPADKTPDKADNPLDDVFALGKEGKGEALVQEMIKVYSERYRFNYSGVVDLRHKQLELTPEFRYEARNMAGFVRVPLLFDVADAKLYADLSALSPWLVNAGSEGKYTRFDMKKYQDKVDVNKVFELLRDTALASYQLGEQVDFKEAALTREDRALGAARKIQFETPLSQYLAKLTTYVAINKDSFQQAAFTKLTDGASTDIEKVEAAAAKPPAQPMDAVAVKALIKNQPEMYDSILKTVEDKLDARSAFRQQALLDAQGRVIRSDWQAQVVTKGMDKYDVSLILSNQVNFSNYGTAVMSYQPKPGNWVDLKASSEGTLFGGLLGKGIFGSALDEYNQKVKEKKALEKNSQNTDK